MKKNFSTLTLILLLAIAGCQKDIKQATEQKDSEIAVVPPRSESPSPSSPIPTVALKVTIDDAAGNMIRSDNGTAYTDGINRVEAQILSSDGNFYMNTNNNTTKLPIRTMQFLPGTDVDLSGNWNYSLRTSPPLDPTINNGNTVWIQNLATGQSQLMSFRAWGVDQHGEVDWKLIFRNGPENNSSSLTDYVRVTRTGANTWTIEPAGISSPSAKARLLTGCDNPLASEFYRAPFKLTLNRK